MERRDIKGVISRERLSGERGVPWCSRPGEEQLSGELGSAAAAIGSRPQTLGAPDCGMSLVCIVCPWTGGRSARTYQMLIDTVR